MVIRNSKLQSRRPVSANAWDGEPRHGLALCVLWEAQGFFLEGTELEVCM